MWIWFIFHCLYKGYVYLYMYVIPTSLQQYIQVLYNSHGTTPTLLVLYNSDVTSTIQHRQYDTDATTVTLQQWRYNIDPTTVTLQQCRCNSDATTVTLQQWRCNSDDTTPTDAATVTLQQWLYNTDNTTTRPTPIFYARQHRHSVSVLEWHVGVGAHESVPVVGFVVGACTVGAYAPTPTCWCWGAFPPHEMTHVTKKEYFGH